jgi:putative peptidoglycan lipid II flippase
MSDRKKHLLSTPVFAILGRAGGIVIPFLVAYYFGAGPRSDAFFFAFVLIFSLSGLFVPIFESLLVPYLTEVKDSRGHVVSLANGVLFLNLPLVLLLGLGIGLGLAPFLNRWSGLDGETAALTARLFLQMLPMLLFGVWAASGNSILYAHKVFWFPAFSPFIRSVCAIGFLVIFHRSLNIDSVAIGFSIGEIIRWGCSLALLVPLVGWKFHVNWKASWAKVKDFMSQAGYHLLGLLSLNLLPLVDQWFASWLGVGNLSLLSYADRLFQIPFQLLMTGFLQIFLSYWSEQYFQGSAKAFWEHVWKDIRMVFALTLVLSLLLILFRDLIVRLLFGFGKMPADDLSVLSTLFGWMMVGFAPAILNLLYVRVLFVLKKSSVFFVQSLIRLILNIVFNFIFMRLWGLQGIAMSTSAVFIGTTIWLHYYLQRTCRKQEERAG